VRLAPLSAALAVLAACPVAQAKTVVYAIAVGNNAAPTDAPGLAPLRYADDDAVRYHALFEGLGADARLLTVLDSETQRRHPGLAARTSAPTLANLLRTVAELGQRMDADRARGDEPLFYFAFSGHGVQPETGPAYLAMTDGGLTRKILREQILAKLPARYSHVIIDACHAGAIVGMRGGGAAPRFDREVSALTVPVTPSEVAQVVDADGLTGLPSVGVIIATTAGQEAHEWSRYESGVFSHEVLSGLSGAADVNGDERIEYTELQAFVAAANRAVPDPRAIPKVIARPPAIDQSAPIVRLDLMRGTRRLHGPVAGLGAFYIEMEDGERVLDAHLGDEMVATLMLPAGRRAFLRSGDREAEIAPGDQAIDTRALVLRPHEIAARGAIDVAYRSGLFAATFSTSYYRGFVDSIGAVGVAGSPVADAPSVRAQPSRWPPAQRAAIGLWASAGALAVASIVTSVFSLTAKADLDATNLQRPAAEANDRYRGFGGAAITTGILTLTGAVAGGICWKLGARP
jgi:hypothetical protein